jgi:DNA-binding transcriptional regulator YhcF (GntR family)
MSAAVYQSIAAEIRDRIDRGELAPGQLVPSARQITREWGVAIATATKVLAALQQDGVVHTVPGVGTVVAGAPGPAPKKSPAEPRQPDLSADAIVRVAIELADDEGLAAVTMRRIATTLGVATMSLYRHVPTKERLVLLMADAVMAAQPPRTARRATDWRATAEATARGFWRLFRRHHWLAQVISLTRPQPLPHGMAHTDALVGALRRLGLDPASALQGAVTIFAYARGLALSLPAQAQDEQDTGITDGQWMQANDAKLMAVAQRRYPNLAAVMNQPVDMELGTLFEVGLGGGGGGGGRPGRGRGGPPPPPPPPTLTPPSAACARDAYRRRRSV